ncbi:helix-turn-helix domain-containing protein [Streptomyces sp. DT117]|uniref:helix-turn-helix domain-containing protein n=1 Tax=Streptomyces sp. DT117 TaxID=3393422 RepID=UPI003CF87892
MIGSADSALMTIDDVSAYLAKPKSWVYANWRTHQIPFKRVGNALRCRLADLDEWLDRQAP